MFSYDFYGLYRVWIQRSPDNRLIIRVSLSMRRTRCVLTDIPDFLWESCYFEDLNSDERKKYIGFYCSYFDMDAYLHESSCYDERLPYFSIIINLVVLSKYLCHLQEQESKYYTDSVAIQEQALPKEKDESSEKEYRIITGVLMESIINKS